MSNHFATHDEIRDKTECVNVSAAIRALNDAAPDNPKALRKAQQRVSELCPAGGPLIFCNQNGTEQVVNDDVHSVTFASTGKGKTRRFVYPSIYSDILAGTNIVVNDMKGEIYDRTRDLLDAMGYQVHVLDLRDPEWSPSRYNPLNNAWDEWHDGRQDAAFLSIRSFGLCLFGNRGLEKDPFWNNSALDYFTGLALSLLESGVTREEFTFESVALLDLEGDSEAMPEYLTNDTLRKRYAEKGVSWLRMHYETLVKDSLARRYLAGTVNASPNTKASIYSVFRQPVSLFVGHRGLMRAMSSSDFTAETLTRKKTAVFLISPDETHVFGSVVVAVLNQLMSSLITVAQRTYHGALPHRVDFFFDEMGNLPAAIPDMEAMVSAARSRNLRFHFVLQSVQQLAHVYGDKLSHVIIDNCDTWVYMGTKSLPFLEELSKLCGTIRTQSGRERPLLPVDTLQRLDTRERETETLVRMGSLKPYITPLRDIGTYETPAKRTTPPSVERHADRKTFDYEAHVRTLVRKFEEEMLKELGGDETLQGKKPEADTPRIKMVEPQGSTNQSRMTESNHAKQRPSAPPKADQLRVLLIHEAMDEGLVRGIGSRLETYGMNVKLARLTAKTTVHVDGSISSQPLVDCLCDWPAHALSYLAPKDMSDARLRVLAKQLHLQSEQHPLFLMGHGDLPSEGLNSGIYVLESKERYSQPLAEGLLNALLDHEELIPLVVDGSITQLEQMGSKNWVELHKVSQSRQTLYDAMGIVLNCKDTLTRTQKDRLWKVCEAKDSLLTYKQRMLLKDCLA